MPKPAPKRKAVKKTAQPRKRASAASRPPAAAPVSKEEAAALLETLIKTGQAAPAGSKLPSGATHALGKDEVGSVKAIRRRFSIS